MTVEVEYEGGGAPGQLLAPRHRPQHQSRYVIGAATARQPSSTKTKWMFPKENATSTAERTTDLKVTFIRKLAHLWKFALLLSDCSCVLSIKTGASHVVQVLRGAKPSRSGCRTSSGGKRSAAQSTTGELLLL